MNRALRRVAAPFAGNSLQKRIILFTAFGILAMLAVLGVSSIMAIRESVGNSLYERLILAESTSNNLEQVLDFNLSRLDAVGFSPGVDLSNPDLQPEKAALHQAYLDSIFTDGVFLLDSDGKVIWCEPFQQKWLGADFSIYPYVREALRTGKPGYSDVFTIGATGQQTAAGITPIKNPYGGIEGATVGYIDLTGSVLRKSIGLLGLGRTGYIEVVDSRGVVLASSKPDLLFTESDHKDVMANLILARRDTVGTCHGCHSESKTKTTEVMAFSPLASASWGVAVRQSESEALAPANQMQQRFIIFGVVLFIVGVIMTWGIARSLVRPVKVLTNAAKKIESGNLSDPIPPLGTDEVGQLGQSLETMRTKLKKSLERIEGWNKELEKNVRERTKELEDSRAVRGDLLNKLITAQEEERRRIARELHDDTSQSLATLAMAIDTTAASASGDGAQWKEKLAGMKALVVNALDGVHQMIFDLRPSVLDDLGLIPALTGYAEKRLEASGVRVRVEVSGAERRLPGHMETAIFRAVQEAITNVAKHAEAENVLISVEFEDSSIFIEVEDDGKGFDPERVTRSADQRSRGLGLLGMKERIELLHGTLAIRSEPGGGTTLSIRVPTASEERPHGQDQSSNS